VKTKENDETKNETYKSGNVHRTAQRRSKDELFAELQVRLVTNNKGTMKRKIRGKDTYIKKAYQRVLFFVRLAFGFRLADGEMDVGLQRLFLPFLILTKETFSREIIRVNQFDKDLVCHCPLWYCRTNSTSFARAFN
jgi:hypothetical protein